MYLPKLRKKQKTNEIMEADKHKPQETEHQTGPTGTSWAAIENEDAIVFSALLSSKSDSNFHRLSCMVAYARYSLNKHQFIQKYTKDEGVPPTDDRIKSLVRCFQDENSDILRDLSQQSERLLTEIIEEYAIKTLEEKIVKPVEEVVKDNTRFWIAVRAGVVASFIYSLLIAIVIFTATAALPDTKFSRIVRILIEGT